MTLNYRAIEQSDLSRLKEWRNRWIKYFRQKYLLSADDQEMWYNTHDDIMWAITENRMLVGACGLTHIDHIHKSCELSFYFGDSYCDLERGKEVLDHLTSQAFKTYNMFRVWVELFNYDEKKKRLLERYGFVLDGILRGAHYDNGVYCDCFIFSLLVDEYDKLVRVTI